MQNNDGALVHRVLAGDDTAFTTLMERYQKQVHATVWRTIKDFHIAEGAMLDLTLLVSLSLLLFMAAVLAFLRGDVN